MLEIEKEKKEGLAIRQYYFSFFNFF